MTDSNDYSFPIPNFLVRTFKSLLLPDQSFNDIFDKVGGLSLTGPKEIMLQKRVWGSNKTTLDRRKPQTLDMFFKTETSNSDSNDESSSGIIDKAHKLSSKMKSSDKTQNSVVRATSPKKRIKEEPIDSESEVSENVDAEINNKIKRSNPSKITSEDKIMTLNERNKKNKSSHSLSASEDESVIFNNSPSSSVDLFNEDNGTSSVGPKPSNERVIEHSISDDEIIPATQPTEVDGTVTRLSLGNLPTTEKSITVKESSKSPKHLSIQKMKSKKTDEHMLRTRADTSSEEENSHPPITQLESKENSMNISEVFSEINFANEKFNCGDFTEDDELYVLQCPSEVDAKMLEGIELSLNGNSIVCLNNDHKFDCCSIKDNLKRNLYVALPDTDKEQMKIEIYPLAGNIILSENYDIPYSQAIKEESLDITTEIKEELVSPKKKKRRSTPDETQDEKSLTEFVNDTETEDVLDTLISKKKKSKRSTEAEPLNNITEIKEELISPKKKKRRSTPDETQDEMSLTESVNDTETEDVLDKLISKKRKSKRSTEDITLGVMTDYFKEPLKDQTLDTSHSKKKKRKSTRDETKEQFSSAESFNDSVTEDMLDKVVSKKKKSKHRRSTEDVMLDNTTEIKEEFISPTHLPKKKKHKSTAEETHNETSSSECFGDVVIEDVLDKLISKKKKSKRRSKEECFNQSLKDDILDSFLSKKKKRKSTIDETKEQLSSADSFNDSVTEDVLDKVVSKKKKSKHRNSEDITLGMKTEYFIEPLKDETLDTSLSKKKKYNETDRDMSDFGKFLNIKTEWEEPQTISNPQDNESEADRSDGGQFLTIKTEWEEPQTVSDPQETPLKPKKRKRKHLDESTENSEVDVPKKKKKKKHSHSESQLMDSPF